jgi:hypothetical protein
LNFRERACSDVGKFRRLICLLTLLSSLRSQPQRNVGWLHRVPYHTYQIVAQGLKVCSASQRDREGFQSLPCVVVPYHLFNNSFEEAYELRLASSMCMFQRIHQPTQDFCLGIPAQS